MSLYSSSYEDYLRSWTLELQSRSNRVRQLIGDAHWLSDGTHKEFLLREFLSRYVPGVTQVSHGFIRSIDGICSNEIDILISRDDIASPYFNEGGLSILSPESVIATIEVKSKFGTQELRQSISRQMKTLSICRKAGITQDPWQATFFYAFSNTRDAGSISDSIRNVTADILTNTNESTPSISLSSEAFQPIVPTCIVLFDEYIVFFRIESESRSVSFKLFRSPGISFAVAAIDLFAHISACISDGHNPTPLEMSRDSLDIECINTMEVYREKIDD